MIARLTALVFLLLLPASALAQQGDQTAGEVEGLRAHERSLAAVQARLRAGQAGVLPIEGAPRGAPRWIEVSRDDLRHQIAVLLADGTIDRARALSVERALDEGSRLVAADLSRIRERIAALEGAR